jgi:hypothetical protein
MLTEEVEDVAATNQATLPLPAIDESTVEIVLVGEVCDDPPTCAADGNQQRLKKQRTIKPLPPKLASITDKDKDKFFIALEKDLNTKSSNYGKEFNCVQSIKIAKDDGSGEEEEYNLKTKLNLDQHRLLCSNLGIKNYGSMNLFQCRQAMAKVCQYATALETAGITPGSNHSLKNNTLCRLINVCFSTQFVDALLTLNDIKNRRDHEGGTTYKEFWVKAADAHNSFVVDDDLDPEFEEIYNPNLQDPHLADLWVDDETNLQKVNNLTSTVFRERVLDLFRIRRKMKENMTKSGTHDNDPYNFVAPVLHGNNQITIMAAYYFYKRCEDYPDIDASFQPFMDSRLKGSTEDLNGDDADSSSPRSEMTTATNTRVPGKKDFYDMLVSSNITTKELLNEYKQVNKKREEYNAKKEADRSLDQLMRLSVILANPNLDQTHREILSKQFNEISAKKNNNDDNEKDNQTNNDGAKTP